MNDSPKELGFQLPTYIEDDPSPEHHRRQLDKIGVNESVTHKYREQYGSRIGDLVEFSLHSLRVISRDQVDQIQSVGIGDILRSITARNKISDPITLCFEPGRSGIFDLLNALKTINSQAWSHVKPGVKFATFDQKGNYPNIPENSHCILMGDISYTGGHINTMRYELGRVRGGDIRDYLIYAGAAEQALKQTTGIPPRNIWLGYKVRNMIDQLKAEGFDDEEIAKVFPGMQFVPDLVTQRYPDSLTGVLELPSGESIFGLNNRNTVLPQINESLLSRINSTDKNDLALMLVRGNEDVESIMAKVGSYAQITDVP